MPHILSLTPVVFEWVNSKDFLNICLALQCPLVSKESHQKYLEIHVTDENTQNYSYYTNICSNLLNVGSNRYNTGQKHYYQALINCVLEIQIIESRKNYSTQNHFKSRTFEVLHHEVTLMTGFLVFIISKSSADKKVYFWMDFFNKLSSLSLIGFSLFLTIVKSSMSRLETSSN